MGREIHKSSIVGQRSSLVAAMLARVLLGALGVTCATGCLSIGGKTYTTAENPELGQRISGLEARVSSLEHSLEGTTPTASAEPNSGRVNSIR